MTSYPLPLPGPEFSPGIAPVVDYDAVLDRLAGSAFRRRKHLLGTELDHLRAHGLPEVVTHAQRFVEERLGPAIPEGDGRQTPYRGHPAFIAQHATGTCCRSCLEIWHSIPKGRVLSSAEIAYVTGLIAAWLRREAGLPRDEPGRIVTAVRAPRRGNSNLKLVRTEPSRRSRTDSGVMVLEEREGGRLLRRWLQLELF